MVMMPFGIDADDAGRDASQHRFREASALIDEVLCMKKFVALRFQLQDHLVERVAERGDVAVGRPDRHRYVEIAGRHLVGGADQLANRPDQPVGHGDAGPDRGKHDDQRQAEIEQREGDLRRRSRSPPGRDTRRCSRVTIWRALMTSGSTSRIV